MSIYEKADKAPYFVLTENLTVIAYISNENVIYLHICYLSVVYILLYISILFNLIRNKQRNSKCNGNLFTKCKGLKCKVGR